MIEYELEQRGKEFFVYEKGNAITAKACFDTLEQAQKFIELLRSIEEFTSL